jgi:hypothetical protein
MIVNNIDNRLAEMQELQEIERIEEEAGIKGSASTDDAQENMAASFMSESIYGKLNSPKARKRRAMSIPFIIKTDPQDGYLRQYCRSISRMEPISEYIIFLASLTSRQSMLIVIP